VLSLAAHRDLNGIAVEAITDCAGINRATFYRHFKDREAAVKAAMDMLFAELTAEDRVFVQAHPHLSPNVAPEGMVSQLLHIADRAELYRHLLGETGSASFAARLRDYQEQQFLKLWHDADVVESPGSAPPAFRARQASGAFQNVLGWWLEEGQTMPAETIATWFWDGIRALWFEQTTRKATAEGKENASNG
jgi:AcrR family transcriptional regulator